MGQTLTGAARWLGWELAALSRLFPSRYRDAWLLADRVDGANNNAERLFKYLLQKYAR